MSYKINVQSFISDVKLSTMSESEIPLMVAICRSISQPKYRCILVEKKKKLLEVIELAAADEETQINSNETFKVKVATSETSEQKPFNPRISVEQAAKILGTDALWVKFEFPVFDVAPPANTVNAFDLLRAAQTVKSSLPEKYKNPSNGSFKLFNKLVDLCRGSKVFFRYAWRNY